jgi:glycosyltransferase involved in cell wall biosynthesis
VPELRIALVTPAYAEEHTLPRLAASVAGQATAPVAWAIVDDGSPDATGEVAAALAASDPRVLAGTRARPPGYAADAGSPAAAFNAGLRMLEDAGVEFEIVMKVDADLELEPGFLTRIAEAFAADPTLGVASGLVLIARAGGVRVEETGGFHTRGATKAYRRVCLAEIGGVVEALGGDTIDEVAAHDRGWRVATVRDARALQVRPTGTATGVLRGRARAGRACHLVGYPLWAVLVRAARRSVEPPYLVGSLAMIYGYLRAWLRREPRTAPPEVVAHLRRTLRQRVLFKLVR